MQRFKHIFIRNFTTNSVPNFINCNKEWSTKKCNRELMYYFNSEIYNKSNKLMKMTKSNGLTIGMSIGIFIPLVINSSFLLSFIPSILIVAIGYEDTSEVKKELFDATSKRDQLYNSYICDSCNDCSKSKNN